ncbi:hypothetical protein SXCC_01235 [Gluconacetobacter sp. SXCC-1]|nr:hypothetical protein SXCC_01235 [Gluconacetobacter sp. SXCC-1]
MPYGAVTGAGLSLPPDWVMCLLLPFVRDNGIGIAQTAFHGLGP